MIAWRWPCTSGETTGTDVSIEVIPFEITQTIHKILNVRNTFDCVDKKNNYYCELRTILSLY